MCAGSTSLQAVHSRVHSSLHSLPSRVGESRSWLHRCSGCLQGHEHARGGVHPRGPRGPSPACLCSPEPGLSRSNSVVSDSCLARRSRFSGCSRSCSNLSAVEACVVLEGRQRPCAISLRAGPRGRRSPHARTRTRGWSLASGSWLSPLGTPRRRAPFALPAPTGGVLVRKGDGPLVPAWASRACAPVRRATSPAESGDCLWTPTCSHVTHAQEVAASERPTPALSRALQAAPNLRRPSRRASRLACARMNGPRRVEAAPQVPRQTLYIEDEQPVEAREARVQFPLWRSSRYALVLRWHSVPARSFL